MGKLQEVVRCLRQHGGFVNESCGQQDVYKRQGEGLLLTPGFIDSHVHVLGGGGEGGFANRTPEATMEGLTKFGVTTVIGCLGTDGIGRDICALVAKTKGLNEQGMSAYLSLIHIYSHISETNVQSGRENHELLENELTKEEYKCRQFL